MDTPSQPSDERCEQEDETRSSQPMAGELDIPDVPRNSLPQACDTEAEEERRKLAVEPFRAVLETLAQLEHDDPKAAAQGARLVSLFRRLWESCVAKQIDSQRLEVGNQQLRAMNKQLQHEGNHLKHTHDDQLYHFRAVEQKLMNARQELLRILKEWSTPCGDLNVLPEDPQGSNGTERLPL